MGIVIKKTLMLDTEIWILYNLSFKNITYVFQIFKSLKIIPRLPSCKKQAEDHKLAHTP